MPAQPGLDPVGLLAQLLLGLLQPGVQALLAVPHGQGHLDGHLPVVDVLAFLQVIDLLAEGLLLLLLVFLELVVGRLAGLVGLLAGLLGGLLDAYQRAVHRAVPADRDELRITGQLVQDVEHERDVVEIERDPQLLDLALFPQREKGRREHVDVGHQDHVELGFRSLLLVLGGHAHAILELAADLGGQDIGPAGLLAPQVVSDHGGAEGVHLHQVPVVHRAGLVAGADQLVELQVLSVQLRVAGLQLRGVRLRDRAGEGEQGVLQLLADLVVVVEGLLGAGALADEHQLLLAAEPPDHRIGIVALPDHLVGEEVDAQQVPERLDVALGRAALAHHHHGVHAGRRIAGLAGGRDPLREPGAGVLEDGGGLSAADRGQEGFHLLRPQRGGLHGQNHVVDLQVAVELALDLLEVLAELVGLLLLVGPQPLELFADFPGAFLQRLALLAPEGVVVGAETVGRHLFDVVLLFQLVDDRPAAGAAHEVGVGVKHAHRLALLAGDGGDGADELVFDGGAAIDEGHHDLLQAGGEGHSHEDVVPSQDAAFSGVHPAGRDAVALVGAGGLVAEPFGVEDLELDLLAAGGLDLPQLVQQVQARLDKRFGDLVLGADEGLDLDGPLRLEALQQLDRGRRERIEPLAGDVPSHQVVLPEKEGHADARGSQGRGAHDVVPR